MQAGEVADLRSKLREAQQEVIKSSERCRQAAERMADGM